MIASPQLSDEDINAINLGYQKREEIIESAFSRDFMKELDALDDAKVCAKIPLVAGRTVSANSMDELLAKIGMQAKVFKV